MVDYDILAWHNAVVEFGEDTIKMNFMVNGERYECNWPLNKELGLLEIMHSLCGAIRHTVWTEEKDNAQSTT